RSTSSSTSFPYTTLFRSALDERAAVAFAQHARDGIFELEPLTKDEGGQARLLPLRADFANVRGQRIEGKQLPRVRALERELELRDRKSTRLNSSHVSISY